MDTPHRLKESERRRATILFADISGFTAMSERIDPEEMTSIMNDCFRMMGSVVERYEGTIDKYIGDCMMALFGVPVAVEDAPWKAVNTALEIRDGLERITRGLPLSVHIGINTGTVVAGSLGADGKKDYTVMGAPVNFAARLKDAAGKGRIFVGPLTYRVTRNDFVYTKRETVSLKSGCRTFPVFEALASRAKNRRPRPCPERSISSPMVGRDGELAKLEALVKKAAGGEGSIVSITGEAGIGKSRLLRELRRMQSVRDVRFFEGRARSTGKNLSFHPVIDALQRWSGIEEGETEAESASKLERAISSVHPADAEEIFPFIATLMGMKLEGKPAERILGIEGGALEKLIQVNLRALLSRAAELNPVVFVIEDLHWADLSSLDLLGSLYRLAYGSRILFIGVLRPNYADTGEKFLRAIRERYPDRHDEMRLVQLREDECRDLVCNLLRTGGLPGRIGRLIAERAEGNPLFIEEVVRSFIDNGVVVPANGTFEVTERIDSAVIPNTIQDLLMSRIDRLDEQTRTLMKYASAIGRSFFYRILAEVAGPIEEINQKLDYLKEIQLIRERRRMAEIEYLFKHALVQEAAYESILLRRRKEIHGRIAASIESVFSGRLREFYGMLAFHYSRAEDIGKAEEYLTRAGEESLKASASNEAMHYYREALKLYLEKYGEAADPEKISGLEKNIALALHNKGRCAEAVAHFDRVLERRGVRSPANTFKSMLRCAADLLGVMAALYLPWKRRKRTPNDRDVETVNLREKRALALAQADTKRLFMETMGILNELNRFDLASVENGPSIYLEGCAVFCFSGASFAIGRKILNHAKGHLDWTDARSAFYYKFNRFLHDYLSGDWPRALDYDEALVDGYLRTGDAFHASAYTLMSGLLRTERGDFGDARLLVDKLRKIAELFDHDYTRGAAHLLNALLLLKRRMLPDAVREADAGVLFLTKNGQEMLALFASAIKINARVLLHEADREPLLVSAVNFMERKKWIAPFYAGNLAISRSLVELSLLQAAISRGDGRETGERKSASGRSARAAVRCAAKYAANKTEAQRLMGVHFWLCGRQDVAMKWFERSIVAGERAGARPELARTYLEAGKRLSEKTNDPRKLNGMKAKDMLDRAEGLFARMDLDWDLKELARVRETAAG